MTVLYSLAFILACASPVLLAVLILKIKEKYFASSGEKMSSDFRSYVVLLCSICLIIVFSWALVTGIGSHITTLFPQSPWAYAMQYNTESQYVVIDPEPHDCEFFKAPIGNKYCHFDKTVITSNGDESMNHKTRVLVSWNKVPE
jgi:hypothetical protein